MPEKSEYLKESEKFGALSGLKVLDIGTTIAGPRTATSLAEFGADVIKIELPNKGDALRSWAPFKNDTSLWWKMIGRNKKAITLNLKSSEGQKIFKEIIKDIDVIIESFRPGTLEKWNLGYSVLSEINPDLILLRISGYGQDGPYSHKPGYGTIAEGISGIPSFTGFPDSPPTLSAFPLADVVASLFGVFSIMSAIYHRDNAADGKGQVIDLSLYESMFRIVDPQVIDFDQLGIIRTRIGNKAEDAMPRNTYQTKEGTWIAISASSNDTFYRLALAIGQPELKDNGKFKDNLDRIENAEELDLILKKWILERSLEEVSSTFEKHDVIFGPINNVEDIFNDPHFKYRENIISVVDKELDEAKVQNVVPKFSKTPGKVKHLGKMLGEDNKEFYCKTLGITEEKLEELIKNEII